MAGRKYLKTCWQQLCSCTCSFHHQEKSEPIVVKPLSLSESCLPSTLANEDTNQKGRAVPSDPKPERVTFTLGSVQCAKEGL